MKKIVYQNTNIDILTQATEEIVSQQCLNGIISRDEDGNFRFEEEIRKGRAPRNPKLYDGTHVSLVKQRDGRYALSLKKIDLTKPFEPSDLAFQIYSDVSSALSIITM